jgi:alkanesulfonate monooxygenase SsuD/methylene tetrahydromethanopterin reductase-like flavin-dependent oxidoreductase (luciferase family)
MEIGIGLPNAVPEVDGKSLIEFARRADRRGFSSLGTIGRLVYQSFECLTSLAAAAAVTERIRLTTAILIAPYYTNTALLAKQAATVDALSRGRLVLGMAIGARDDDYEASGVSMRGRGTVLTRQIEEMKRIWAGEKRGYAGAIGPKPVQSGGPELILGGGTDASFERAANYASGWIMGALPPDQFPPLAEKMDAAWARAGREGKPRKLSLAYFALGPNAQEQADHDLKHYYAWLGEIADQIAAGAAVGEDMVRSRVEAFESAGCDELILSPTSPDPGQVDLLADAVGM